MIFYRFVRYPYAPRNAWERLDKDQLWPFVNTSTMLVEARAFLGLR